MGITIAKMQTLATEHELTKRTENDPNINFFGQISPIFAKWILSRRECLLERYRDKKSEYKLEGKLLKLPCQRVSVYLDFHPASDIHSCSLDCDLYCNYLTYFF